MSQKNDVIYLLLGKHLTECYTRENNNYGPISIEALPQYYKDLSYSLLDEKIMNGGGAVMFTRENFDKAAEEMLRYYPDFAPIPQPLYVAFSEAINDWVKHSFFNSEVRDMLIPIAQTHRMKAILSAMIEDNTADNSAQTVDIDGLYNDIVFAAETLNKVSAHIEKMREEKQ